MTLIVGDPINSDVVLGTAGTGDETLRGGQGNDTLYGDGDPWATPPTTTGGNDTLEGGEGDDFLVGGFGSNYFDGGAGVDTAEITPSASLADTSFNPVITFGFEAGEGVWREDGAVVNRTVGVENVRLFGAANDDTLVGGDGDDVLIGNAGSDSLIGGAGDDYLADRDPGNAGELDILDGGEGYDRAQIGSPLFYNDTVFNTPPRSSAMNGDTLEIREGGELVAKVLNAEDITLYGTAGADTLRTGDTQDIILAGDEDDLIAPGAGFAQVRGGEGADTLVLDGAESDYTITASSWDFFGSNGVETLPVQILTGTNGDQIIAAEIETIVYGGAADTTEGGGSGDGGDTVAPPSTGFDDTIQGDPSAADSIDAGAGDDVIDISRTDYLENTAGLPTDTVDGGEGNDTVTAGNSSGGQTGTVTFDGSQPTATLVENGVTTAEITNVENFTIYAGQGDDTLTGGDGNDWLDGGDGDNVVSGGTGDDTLWVNAGINTIDGGDGEDTSHIFAHVGTFQAGLTYGVDGTSGTLKAGDTVITTVVNVERHGVTGSNLADSLVGGDGDDNLKGGFGSLTGDDTLIGGGGNDRLDASRGGPPRAPVDENVLIGGTGDDTATLGDFTQENTGDAVFAIDNGTATLVETGVTTATITEVENYHIYTGKGDDLITAGSGNDWVFSGGGADTLDGGAGSDWLSGDDGDDLLSGGEGNDDLDGRTGSDTLFGGDGDDSLDGGEDDDLLSPGAGSAVVIGGEGADTVVLDGARADYAVTEADGVVSLTLGADVVTVEGVETFAFSDASFTAATVLEDPATGGTGSDTGGGSGGGTGGTGGGSGGGTTVPPTVPTTSATTGSDGDDTLEGTDEADTVEGGAGADTISGGGGADTLFSGEGDDVAFGGEGDDLIFGGSGNDTTAGGDGDDQLYGGDGDDQQAGGEGNDTLGGGDGNDAGFGGGGVDNLFGATGSDTLYGGDGDDKAYGGTENDTLAGGDGSDELGLGQGDDQAAAGDGDDIVFGGAGADTVFAGTGADTVYGGTGDDVVFLGGTDGAADVYGSVAENGSDVIFGFEDGTDRLDLTASGLTSFADIAARIGQDANGNATIDLGGGDVLTLSGLDPSLLGADDFVL